MKGSRPLTPHELATIKPLFSGRMARRNLALFCLGVNTGYRISELLSLTLGDVIDKNGDFKEYATVARRNMKGSHEGRSVPLNASAKNALRPWLRELERRGYGHKDDFLFQSQKAGDGAISIKTAWRVLEDAYRAGGLTGRLGTHAMRKTFANTIYDHFLARAASGESIDPFRCTSKALDHKDIKSTDQYLSFRNEDVYLAIHALEN
jgi:integrase